MILALETSTRRASLAVVSGSDGELCWEAAFETDRSHNSKIFDPVQEALDRFGDALTAIAVGIGPGSYGGIRVGIAVANGLSVSRGLPVECLPWKRLVKRMGRTSMWSGMRGGKHFS